MNCKPGDLAVVVCAGRLEGRVIRVTSLDPGRSPCGRPLWLYEGDLTDPDGFRYESIWDHILRPLRDPGDDAVDEMVVIAGKPEHQPA